MKGFGWVGIILIAAGAVTIWSGYQGVSVVSVLQSVLTNSPMPGSDAAKAANAAAIEESTPEELNPLVFATLDIAELVTTTNEGTA